MIHKFEDLDQKVIAALNAKVKKLLVTSEIIEKVLQQNYKKDPMMVYKNMPLYDYKTVSETEVRDAQDINERVFGKSKVTIADTRPPQGPAAQ